MSVYMGYSFSGGAARLNKLAVPIASYMIDLVAKGTKHLAAPTSLSCQACAACTTETLAVTDLYL